MLVKAHEECTDILRGNVTGCSIFEASIDEDKAFNCFAQGEVATEVGPLPSRSLLTM